MFDVIWTDPDRELVGEHRAKKEKKREQKGKEKAKEQDLDKSISRRSLSIRSARSSTDSPFGFLRSRAAKQAKANGNTKPNSTGLLTPSILSSRSPLSSASDAGSYRHSALLADVSDISLEATRAAKGKRCSSGPEPSHLFQPLGPASYVSKRTEVSWIPRTSESDNQDLSSEVFISSEADTDPPVTPSGSVGDRNYPVPLLRADSPVNLAPGVRFAAQTKTSPVINFTPNDPDAWRPPEEWECLTGEKEDAGQVETLQTALDEMNIGDIIDLESLQKEVKRMAAASPNVVLSRIKEVWRTADETLHQELEMEKKRWMLSTLHHLDPVPKPGAVPMSPLSVEESSNKVLALYESQVTASYLAALHSTKEIYHMSATPLSHSKFPSIHPVLVPSVSPSAFPVAPNLFETVYSLSLPAICSSPDILSVLKNISKCLRPGGSLQLTLIDPLPCAGTLGHRMRTWLEEHLLINLERQFRCVNPSKLFPDWLGDASLRGRGSTLTTAKFYAVPESVRGRADESDPFIDRVRTEREIKAELRSLVGRMLWMEVWGGYVTGEKWWWEDEGCVEECLELGTFWEYNMIEGVKDREA
ncbi:hypothetical protein FZEAL_2285 [Fusarium zealandicum]|uniref:Uncharacterized protein n=1 Tax=Fusarium zealandicum TaxID=1053134 RepID=A0A8H4XNS2_9HYPO|nr:hypothetical protein FZEAL_2285 [Fusarium zealandicum]